MKHGFVKVASGTPEVKVADIDYNIEKIKEIIYKADEEKVKLLVLPELCITGYTCGDLFFQKVLLNKAVEALNTLTEFTLKLNVITTVGLPLLLDGNLYNCAAVLHSGKILGIVPKTYIPNYNEFYEKRQFSEAQYVNKTIKLNGRDIDFSTNLIFRCERMPEFSFAVEICEDLWAPISPSTYHALAGANIIANLSASNELIGKDSYRRQLVSSTSARLICGYIYSDAGEGESTTDIVFSGHNIIAENGHILKESELFTNGLTSTEIDVFKISSERHKITTFKNIGGENYKFILFNIDIEETKLTRKVDKSPFIPTDLGKREEILDKILKLQAYGLKKRLLHTNAKKLVIGISGGLDSSLALIVAVKTMSLANRKTEDIVAITMPCFGTSERTRNNACKLCKLLGVTLREIDISNTVLSHFNDIGHKADVYDISYENGQARERTQVLMDIANMENGMVIGTGDLSENALGWSTYNGDHMSMYAVNISVPKTLIRHIIDYYADGIKNEELKKVLKDILETPVSPELLPGKDISQKTEDIVGPYELHDFFLYYAIRWGFEPSKVFRLAEYAFHDVYSDETILKWLKIFYKRFFTQQFKRSCMPDGVKIGSVSLSPRGDLRMPSDSSYNVWLRDIDFEN